MLLLQEALNRQLAPGDGVADDLSATRVASELTKMTGDPYAIVVDPGRRQRPAKGVSMETAIVANLETMNYPSAAGFVNSNAFKAKREFKHTGPNRPVRPPSRRQAWAVIAESDPQGLTFPVASVHYLTDKRLGCTKGAPCQRRVNKLKVHWTEQVERGAERLTPGTPSIARSSAATSTPRARTASSAASSGSATTRRSAGASTTSSTAASRA